MDEQLFHKFLNWERATRDTIDFKKIYVDMAGDHLAGLVLSEIVFWHLPNGQGARHKRRFEYCSRSQNDDAGAGSRPVRGGWSAYWSSS